MSFIHSFPFLHPIMFYLLVEARAEKLFWIPPSFKPQVSVTRSCWLNLPNLSLFFSDSYSFIYFFNLFIYFTILYWFCHTLTLISHGCTCVPHPEYHHPHLPPHSIFLSHPSAPVLSTLYHALNLDWLIWYFFTNLLIWQTTLQIS